MDHKRTRAHSLSVKNCLQHSLADENIVTRKISRRTALSTLGATAGVGALGGLLGGCVTGVYDADPHDGVGGASSGSEYGSGSQRRHDIKLGDRNDYTVYADFRDLDSDTRDTSDHYNARTADASSANDYD